ncbi:PREDICTED: uncharacterized protein LOC104587060 [Nelumbo nucifera]|uniref:Uncharacterized protein LOC104587060 n=2 Tax=Nelumbo nucifera TaxID=4432 RepID=A0A1U7YUB8_NELNU|nr:PREDICTED: uncharacterized protein LOC104587060 [Nelumbo nucifera]DAD39692.1 TPA_asm: hypothetical protein HUJ06_014015 [Nelumbo nucifera]
MIQTSRSAAETSLLLQLKSGNYSAKGSFDPPSFCWTPPQEAFVKINVDGRFRALNKASYGIIARDSTGFCHWASCGPLLAESPLMAEALVAAVKVVRRSGLSRVFVESDCQNLISHLNSSANFSPSDLVFLKEDLVSLCEGLEIKFLWCRLSADGAAHELAKLGFDSVLWFEGALPDWLSSLICSIA